VGQGFFWWGLGIASKLPPRKNFITDSPEFSWPGTRDKEVKKQNTHADKTGSHADHWEGPNGSHQIQHDQNGGEVAVMIRAEAGVVVDHLAIVSAALWRT
jgi:hypothetical protein